jgi:hypothetical protein
MRVLLAAAHRDARMALACAPADTARVNAG